METPQQAVSYNRAGAAAASGIPGQTLDIAIKSGELPVIRTGRRVIILQEDLLAWLRKCKARGSIPTPISDADRERFAALNRARKEEARIAAEKAEAEHIAAEERASDDGRPHEPAAA